MRLGTVQFYKYLILIVLVLLIVVPTSTTIFLLVDNHNMKNKMTAFQGNDIESVMNQGDMVNVEDENVDAIFSSLISYQNLFPDFFVESLTGEYKDIDRKVVYLTFDDGPTSGTIKLLDLLDEYDVKATFFVNGRTSAESYAQMKETSDRGHAIGMHGYSHKYEYIYESVENFLDDFNNCSLFIEASTGIKPTVYRFPGGSINSYNVKNYKEIIGEMYRRGYIYYDWNVGSADTVNGISASAVAKNVVSGVMNNPTYSIVLMHDNPRNNNMNALPVIIESLKKEGYVFESLDNTVMPPTFSYREE